ncbi:MAG TPA: heme ABC transporter ATP-binding protein, partial [Tissierella sp.]|nr:heme ABC transporter ATP-binding protein [Tissierella sp.]
EVEPNELIEDVSVGMQQKVEIIKALYRGADILILDEPTAVLTPQEIVELLNIMNKLIEDGKTIIIITHKLKEIKQSAEECTILRRGKYIDTVNVADVNEEELAKKMVGRSVNLVADKSPAQVGDVVFEIKNLFVKNEKELYAVKDLSLEIRKGEIMGIAGIDGNGQKELVEAITNLRPAEKGQIIINGVEIQNTSPNNVIKNKVATIHEDRQKVGLVLDFTVAENIIIENFKSPKYSKNGIILKDKIINKAKELIKKFDIRPSDSEELAVKGLSGGNQQKVIIAREVENNPDLLIAVQPTRGLDVGAIEFIHKTLIEERDKGKAILLISYELDEVMNLSDTLAVIYDGCIVNTFKQGTIDENTIGLLMAGGKVSEQNI